MAFALAFVRVFVAGASDLLFSWEFRSVFLASLLRRDRIDSFILEVVLEVGRNDERGLVKEDMGLVTDPFSSVFMRVDSLE